MKMGGDEAIIEWVNCPKSRWIYRGIAMLAFVVLFTRFTAELLWPSLCSSWSTWKEVPTGVVLMSTSPFFFFAGMVVRSFCVPVPVPFPRAYGSWSFGVAIGMTSVCYISNYGHTLEWCIYGFSVMAGTFATMQLSWPRNDVSVQQLVYVCCVLFLVGYLGAQRHVWLTCVFLAALILLNTLLFEGLLSLQLKRPKKKEDFASI